MFLFEASSGSTSASSCILSSTSRISSELLSTIFLTGWMTVISFAYDRPLSSAVIVIVTVPALIPFTTPSSSTTAILLSLVSHSTFLLVVFAGTKTGSRLISSPTLTESGPVNETLSASILETVTVHCAVLFPSAVVTVITAVPAFSA